MSIKAIVLIVAGVLLLSANVMAEKPTGTVRNVDFELRVLEEPKQIGDIMRVSWSFTLRESEDPVLQIYQNKQESAMFARAYLSGINTSEVIEGEAVWRGEIEYNKTYEFMVSSTVETPGKICIRPVVEIYSEPNNESYSTRRSRNVGEMTTINVESDIVGHESPREFSKDQFQITSDLVPASIKRCAELIGDSTFIRVNNSREMMPTDGVSGDDSKQTWSLSGEFDYEDAFGGTSNPVARTLCWLYQWSGGDPYYQALSGLYTDSDGGFQFYTNVDSITIVLFAIDSFSNVFYATDSCLDYNKGEALDYHSVSISLANPSHNNISVPSAYTHIDDLSMAGVFHIQAILRNAHDEIGFPDFEAPVYFLDKDECAENSSFGDFDVDDIPCIKIRGSYDELDWDQWDTSVVDHELGHLYQWTNASMPLYSGGTHYFNSPTPTSGVNDLYLAFVEAWATFFSCRVIDNPIYIDRAYDIEDTIIWIDLEQPSPDVPFTLDMPQTEPSDTVPYYEGAHVEGSIALALWDLYDDVDDGDYYIGQDLWGHNNDSNANENWHGWDAIHDVLVNFDPNPYDADHENCWSIYEFIHGWRTLDYSTDATFTNIFEAHAVPVFIPGDTNEDGVINIFDITLIITYLYLDGPPPKIMSSADVNADCMVNNLDITYVLDNLYTGGPALLVGCYNMYP